MSLIALAIWVGLSAVVGAGASNRGRSGAGFFCLSLLLSPLIGAFVLLVLGAKPLLTPEQAEAREAIRFRRARENRHAGLVIVGGLAVLWLVSQGITAANHWLHSSTPATHSISWDRSCAENPGDAARFNLRICGTPAPFPADRIPANNIAH